MESKTITSIDHGLKAGDPVTFRQSLFMRFIKWICFWLKWDNYEVVSIDSATSFTFERR